MPDDDVSNIAAEHPIVSKVVGDPSSGEPVTVLAGYVGRSTREGYLRLYGSPNFDSYVEVEISAVLHRRDAAETIPAGGSLLWVKSGAMVTRHTRTPDVALGGATFLAGDIVKQNMLALKQAQAQTYPFRGGIAPLWGSDPRICYSIDVCPYSQAPCPTQPVWACGGFSELCQPF